MLLSECEFHLQRSHLLYYSFTLPKKKLGINLGNFVTYITIATVSLTTSAKRINLQLKVAKTIVTFIISHNMKGLIQ
jgi:hypothetical protein